jgi:predicted GNAT family acetyltransferase
VNNEGRTASEGIVVTHDEAACRFEAVIDGHLSVCEYRMRDHTAMFVHTEVPSALQGRGVAAALVGAALQWARAGGLRVRPMCSYVAAYMRRHPETQDLLNG